MNTIDASLRSTKTSGEVNKLRSEGNVPGIVYGGKSETQKISISKKLKNLKTLIKKNFIKKRQKLFQQIYLKIQKIKLRIFMMTIKRIKKKRKSNQKNKEN